MEDHSTYVHLSVLIQVVSIPHALQEASPTSLLEHSLDCDHMRSHALRFMSNSSKLLAPKLVSLVLESTDVLFMNVPSAYKPI